MAKPLPKFNSEKVEKNWEAYTDFEVSDSQIISFKIEKVEGKKCTHNIALLHLWGGNTEIRTILTDEVAESLEKGEITEYSKLTLRGSGQHSPFQKREKEGIPFIVKIV